MTQTTEVPDTDDIVQAILSPAATREDLLKLVKTIRAHEGRPVGFASWDGDICPRWKFPYPPPPRFDDFLSGLMNDGHPFRVFPIGIPAPEELLVDIRTRSNRISSRAAAGQRPRSASWR